MTDLIEKLLQQADEIADEGHAGWGNTMRNAAAELTALRESHARLLDAVNAGWENRCEEHGGHGDRLGSDCLVCRAAEQSQEEVE